MKKIVFAISAALLVLLTFSVMSASAQTTTTQAETDCVMLTGTIEGYYSTINPCETVTTTLESVPVTITDNTFGKVQTVTTTVTTTKFFGLKVIPGGDFAASVHKNLEYTIDVDVTLNIDGVDYVFKDSQVVSVGETDAAVSFFIHGQLVKPESKSATNFALFNTIVNRLAARYPGIFALF